MEYLGYHNDFSKRKLIDQKREEAKRNGWKVKEETEEKGDSKEKVESRKR